jgi:hypothetical protein
MGTQVVRERRAVVEPPSSGTQSITTRRTKTQTADAVHRYISVYVGPSTASAAVTGCCRALGHEPENLELADVPELLAALRPMLATLLGDASCRILLRRIAQNLGS